jgi:hypothetical protein
VLQLKSFKYFGFERSSSFDKADSDNEPQNKQVFEEEDEKPADSLILTAEQKRQAKCMILSSA